MTENETDSFEAFDLVASALEELDLYQAAVKAHQLQGKNDFSTTSINDEKSPGAFHNQAVENARRYLDQAVTKPEATTATLTEAKPPSGDPDYFKAHYLLAMTDYFRGAPDAAANLFERILDPPSSPDTSAHLAAKKAHANATTTFLNEVRYNLGAAFLEMDQLEKALHQFDLVIESAGNRDLTLKLLAQAGKALAHSYQRDYSDARAEQHQVKRQLRRDAIFLFRIGWRTGSWRGEIGWPGEIVIRQRQIDERTESTIRHILKNVEDELKGKSGRHVRVAS